MGGVDTASSEMSDTATWEVLRRDDRCRYRDMRDIFSVSLCCCVCIFAVSASDLSITRETERDADTARLRHLSWIAVLCRCVCIARVAVSASHLSVTWDTVSHVTHSVTCLHRISLSHGTQRDAMQTQRHSDTAVSHVMTMQTQDADARCT